MIEAIGDFWKYADSEKYDVLVCTINKVVKSDGRLVMGAGIAKEFRDRYKNLGPDHTDIDWFFGWIESERQAGKNLRSITILHDFVTGLNYDIVGLATKRHWKNPSELQLIRESCTDLLKYVKEKNKKNVLMTRPGCGLGGLEWSDVKPHLEEIGLDERFTVINAR